MSDPRYFQKGFNKQLAHFIEECGEALAAAGKTQRWGRESSNPLLKPDDENYSETNQDWLVREIRDVKQAADRLLKTMGYEK